MRLVSFDDWTLRGRWWPTLRRRGVALAVIVHHSVTRASTSSLQSVRVVEEIIYQRRIRSRFSMIAYGWLIAPDGTVFEGRGATWRNGANNNTRGGSLSNGNTVSICFIGDFRTDTVTPAARQAFFELVAQLEADGVIAADHQLLEHSELAHTECAAGALAQVFAGETPVPIPQPIADDEEDDDMKTPIVTYHDTSRRSAVVINHDNNTVRPISDVDAWLRTWTGPVVAADNLRLVLRDLGFEDVPV
ncbi:MAG: N-acetylmuramoyl-L-alanine amidase [Actinomycetota bacterium]